MPSTVTGSCARAMAGIVTVGLPVGWEVRCGSAWTYGHAAVACMYCAEAGGQVRYIGIHPAKGDDPGVGAHEACHAQEYERTGATTEASADACAAAHGLPNPYAT